MTDETEIKDIKEFLDLEEKIKDYYSKHSTEVEIARKLSVLEAKVEQLVKEARFSITNQEQLKRLGLRLNKPTADFKERVNEILGFVDSIEQFRDMRYAYETELKKLGLSLGVTPDELQMRVERITRGVEHIMRIGLAFSMEETEFMSRVDYILGIMQTATEVESESNKTPAKAKPKKEDKKKAAAKKTAPKKTGKGKGKKKATKKEEKEEKEEKPPKPEKENPAENGGKVEVSDAIKKWVCEQGFGAVIKPEQIAKKFVISETKASLIIDELENQEYVFRPAGRDGPAEVIRTVQ